MIYIRRSHERGRSQYEWLDSFHTFSFSNYYDPGFMGFGSLRVINEDTVQGGQGFGRHPHEDMEIISYVVEGALAHQDSMGTGAVIKPGEIQKMSAGTGVEHSEFNHSPTEKVHFLQIWIIPREKGLKPVYEQKKIPQDKNQLILLGDDSGEGLITIYQDVKLYGAYLEANKDIQYTINDGRGVWLQLIKGSIHLNDQAIEKGDGVAIFDENQIDIRAEEPAEFLLFDVSIRQE